MYIIYKGMLLSSSGNLRSVITSQNFSTTSTSCSSLCDITEDHSESCFEVTKHMKGATQQ